MSLVDKVIVQEVFKKTLFWDVDINRLNPERDWYFIIERIVEYGDLEEIDWLKRNYPPERLRYVMTTSRILSKKTLNFLRLLIDREFNTHED